VLRTVRFWWNRFGPMFAAEIRKRRVNHRSYSQFEVFATKRRDRKAALKFLKRTMKRYGPPRFIVTDRLRSFLKTSSAAEILAFQPTAG
jgi:putative transposase